MANIEQELLAFKNAKKGEDVRDSMISAIRKINTVNEEGVEEIEEKTEQMVEVADSMIQIDEEPTSYTKLKFETTGTDIEIVTLEELDEQLAETEIGEEVVDARIGYDEIVYQSTGEAIRTQIGDLKNNFDTVNTLTGAIDGFIGYNATLQIDGSQITVTKGDASNFYAIGIKNENITFTLNNVEYLPIAYGISPNTQNYEFILAVVIANNSNFGKGHVFIHNVNNDQVGSDHAVSTQLLNSNTAFSSNPKIEYSYSGTNVTISYNGVESTIDISEIAVSTTLSGNFSVPMTGAILHQSTHGASYIFSYENMFSKIDTRLEIVEELTKQRWKGKTWCAFGDSITAMEMYEPLVQTQLNLTSFENMGSGGSTIAELYSGQSAAYCNRYDTIASGFDVITLFGGTNDFGKNIPLGTKGSTDKTTFYGGLSALLKGIKAKFPTTPILFFTPLQRDYFGTAEEISGMVNGNGNTLKEYRDIIIEMCAEEGIPCFDLYGLSGLYPENVHTWTTDGLHPNQTFWNTHYQLIGDFINKYLPTN